MKKRLGFLVMLVCVLAFGLVFVGCKSDDGGGGIPSLAGFKASDLTGIDLVLSGSALTEATAEAVITPIFELLEDRYNILQQFLSNKIGEDFSSGPVNLNLSNYKNDSDLTGYGMENLAGSGRGSGTGSITSYTISQTINFTHDYDSDNDSDKSTFIGGSDTVKGKVKGSVKLTDGENSSSVSESEAVALSYAVAFNYGSNSGYAIVTVGWAYSAATIKATGIPSFTSGPTANVKFDLYAPNGSFIVSQTFSGEDALDMLGFYD